jgi:hypothetical protein
MLSHGSTENKWKKIEEFPLFVETIHYTIPTTKSYRTTKIKKKTIFFVLFFSHFIFGKKVGIIWHEKNGGNIYYFICATNMLREYLSFEILLKL